MGFLDSLSGFVRAIAPIAVPTIQSVLQTRAASQVEREIARTRGISVGTPPFFPTPLPPGFGFPVPESVFGIPLGQQRPFEMPPQQPATVALPPAPIIPPEVIAAVLSRTGSPVVTPAAKVADPASASGLLEQLMQMFPGVLNLQPGGGGGQVAPSMGCATGPNSCSSLFVPTCNGTSLRAANTVTAINPVTGKMAWFKNMGQPVLFSGDLQAVKRVKRVASKTNRALPRRATTRRRTTARRR